MYVSLLSYESSHTHTEDVNHTVHKGIGLVCMIIAESMASVQQALAEAQSENRRRFQKDKEDALLAAKERWKKETDSRIMEVNCVCM